MKIEVFLCFIILLIGIFATIFIIKICLNRASIMEQAIKEMQFSENSSSVEEYKEYWEVSHVFWVEGNFTKEYAEINPNCIGNCGYSFPSDSYLGVIGGGGGRLIGRDENGIYTWKSNTDIDYLKSICNKEELYSGGIVYPERNEIQVICNKKVIKEVFKE